MTAYRTKGVGLEEEEGRVDGEEEVRSSWWEGKIRLIHNTRGKASRIPRGNGAI